MTVVVVVASTVDGDGLVGSSLSVVRQLDTVLKLLHRDRRYNSPHLDLWEPFSRSVD